jgi:hypothetical protein
VVTRGRATYHDEAVEAWPDRVCQGHCEENDEYRRCGLRKSAYEVRMIAVEEKLTGKGII